MLNFNRRPEEPKEAPRGLRPAIYEPPGAAGRASAAVPVHAPPPVQHEAPPPPVAAPTVPEPVLTEAQGSRLAVGVNIKLKGVEISDCDILHIEGHVEATVHSKAMEIAKPGTLKGTALIDVAEIHGEFSGELTARLRLVVHGTGRVSGTIRYGKLIVEEGGEINGDVKRLEAPDDAAARPHTQPHAQPHTQPHTQPHGQAHSHPDARLVLRPSRESS